MKALIQNTEKHVYSGKTQINENKEFLIQANIALSQLLSKSEIDRDGIDALEVKNRTKMLKYSWYLYQDRLNYGCKKKEETDPIHYKGVQKCR